MDHFFFIVCFCSSKSMNLTSVSLLSPFPSLLFISSLLSCCNSMAQVLVLFSVYTLLIVITHLATKPFLSLLPKFLVPLRSLTWTINTFPFWGTTTYLSFALSLCMWNFPFPIYSQFSSFNGRHFDIYICLDQKKSGNHSPCCPLSPSHIIKFYFALHITHP